MTCNKNIYTLLCLFRLLVSLALLHLGPTLLKDLYQGHVILLGEEKKKAILEPCEGFQIFCSKMIQLHSHTY